MPVTKPNLFLVGFQKCGSSSLFDLLLQHPEISGSNPKETFALVDEHKTNYHCEMNVKNPGFDWDVFFVPQKTTYYLEASVCNFYQKTALDYIANLTYKKVIFIVRDPVQRFCSSYEYYGPHITTQPHTNLTEFFEVVSSQPEKIDVEGAKFALEHGKYVKYIRLWENALGKNNVHIVGMRNMLEYPDNCMKEISTFLDLQPMQEPVFLGHKNKTRHLRSKKLDFYIRRLMGGTGIGKSFLGNVYQKINSTNAKLMIGKDIRQKLVELYREEYQNLKEYL